MGEVISMAFTPKKVDGGKSRILRQRAMLGDNFRWPSAEPLYDDRQDLVMDSADPAGYVAPDTDCAGTHGGDAR